MASPRAILLMTLAMAIFAVSDAVIKRLGEVVGAFQTIFVVSVISLLFFLPLLWRAGDRLFSSRALGRAMIIRTLGEVGGAIGVVGGLAVLPLSLVAALLQAQPLVLTAVAALFLSEKVGWRRWAAVVVGFAGVMLILRPTGEAFEITLLLPLLGVLGLTARDLGTRLLPPDISTPFAASWAILAVGAVGAVGMALTGGWSAMSGLAWALAGAAAVCVSLAYAAITAALRVGDLSAVAPFRYTRIVFAFAIAWIVFDERPDLFVWLGLALIIFSGLYTFWREQRQAPGR